MGLEELVQLGFFYLLSPVFLGGVTGILQPGGRNTWDRGQEEGFVNFKIESTRQGINGWLGSTTFNTSDSKSFIRATAETAQ